MYAMEEWSLERKRVPENTSEMVSLLDRVNKHQDVYWEDKQTKKIQKELNRNIKELPAELQCHIFYNLDDLPIPTLCRFAHDVKLSPASVKKVEYAHYDYITHKSISIDTTKTGKDRFQAYKQLMQEVTGFMKQPHEHDKGYAHKNFGDTWSDVCTLNRCVDNHTWCSSHAVIVQKWLDHFVERTQTQAEYFYHAWNYSDGNIDDYKGMRSNLIEFLRTKLSRKVNSCDTTSCLLSSPKYLLSLSMLGFGGYYMYASGQVPMIREACTVPI